MSEEAAVGERPLFSRPPAGRYRRRRWLTGIMLCVGLLTLSACKPAPTCATSGPGGGAYSVNLCFTLPGKGAVLKGDTTVTATVAIAPAGGALVAKLIFYLDGAYLLTDLESPYTFVLPTKKFVDGTKTLGVVAIMRDGYTTPVNNISLTFNNGVTAPPVNTNTFTPTPGSDPALGAPFVFAATGDGASGRTQADGVVSLMNSWQPNLFAYLGDVYEKGTPTEFYNWYGSAGSRWSSLRSVTNPAVGNHEYENGVAPGYFDYWDNVPDYYSYNSNGWHFIALNSTSQFGQGAQGSAQYDWLAADLAANTSACTVAYFHHPLLNIGPEGNNTSFDPMWKLMADRGVDVVLTGHDHNYQRWTPVDRNYQPDVGGMTQFVAGAGGQGVRPFATSDSRVVAGYDTAPQALGALRFELNPAGASFTYRNTAGATLDNGVIPCNGAGPDTQKPTKPTGLTATPVTGPDAVLNWAASTDNVGVSEYTILRDAAPIATVPGHLTTYTDTSVAPNATYSYKVVARDLAGNESPSSSAATVTVGGIPPVVTFALAADAYVNADAPTINYGSSSVLRVDGSPDQRTYLRVAVSRIVGHVVSAKLRLYANSSHSSGFIVESVADGSWSESAVTYGTAPAFGPPIGPSGALTAGSYVEIPVDAVVTGDGTYSFALTTLNSTGVNLASRESTTPPQLVIEQDASGNSPPVAGDLSVTTDQEQAVTWTPPVSDPDPGALTCSIGAGAVSGAATVAPDCSSGSYTPAAAFNGSDTFTYVVSDGTLTATGTASVTVNAVPQRVLTIPVVADAYVSSDFPTTNYGSSSVLRVDGSPDQRSYLRADVSGVVGAVVSANLRVYANSSHGTGFVVQDVADDSWDEASIAYSTAPAFGPVIGPSGPLTSGGYVEVPVQAVVTGDGTYSFVLTALNTTGISLGSRSSANPPQLVIVQALA